MASRPHPAMLPYLDNAISTKANPNENYGRELLELHTVGLDAGYTEDGRAAQSAPGCSPADRRLGHRARTGTTPRWHATGAGAGARLQPRRTTRPRGEAAARRRCCDYLAHAPGHRRSGSHQAVRAVRRRRAAGLAGRHAGQGLPGRTAPRSRRCCARCSRSAEFAAVVGAEGAHARARTSSRRCGSLGAPEADAHGTDRHAGGALLDDRDASATRRWRWAPPNGYPDVAAAWASPAGYAGPLEHAPDPGRRLVAKQLARPPAAEAPACRTLPATYGELVDALARAAVFGTLRRRTAHAAVLPPSSARRRPSPLKATDSDGRWRRSPTWWPSSSTRPTSAVTVTTMTTVHCGCAEDDQVTRTVPAAGCSARR